MLVVQKYGGVTLETPEKIKAIAEKIAQRSSQGDQVVCVVSAMGQTTNQLIDLAQKVSSNPSRRELDMLLTTGERISMALMSIALNDIKCSAISLTGSQAGILTNTSHVNALIDDVKAFRVEEELKKNKVVIIAGFQGVSPFTKEITTLGRGGSDTSAVAIAAYLKADCCEILKDVPAIFSADPKLCPQAVPLESLSYNQLLEMTFWGAKVLHYRSVELAKNKKVTLYIGPAHQQYNKGTIVSEENMFESEKIISLNSHKKIINCELISSFENFLQELEKNEIAAPQILEIDQKSIYLTGPAEILTSICNLQSPSFKVSNLNIASVTATCSGSTTPAVAQAILKKCSEHNIKVVKLINSAMSTTVFVEAEFAAQTIQALHQLI